MVGPARELTLPKFKPSEKSKPPETRVIAALQYIGEAAEMLEEQARTGGLPGWVETRVTQAASLMGTAMSYVHHVQRDQ
jgi:hypothetical protein